MDWKQAQETVVPAVREAGAITVEHYRRGVRAERKGRIDLVTEADRASENHLLAALSAAFPDHDILAEESGVHAQGGNFRWVIDPLDGTTNFAHGLVHWSVLVAGQARAESGDFETQLGICFDPCRDEMFVARKGAGAWCNDKPIHVSRTGQLIDAIVATGFPYDRVARGDEADNHREFCRLNLVTQGVRRFGSAGLDLAYVASGRFDGFWEYGLNPWDLASGALLVAEAGGTVTGVDGGNFRPDDGSLIATNGPLHGPLRGALAEARAHPTNSREGLAP